MVKFNLEFKVNHFLPSKDIGSLQKMKWRCYLF